MNNHEQQVDEFEEKLKETYRRESDKPRIDLWVSEFRTAIENRLEEDDERDQEEIREEERRTINSNLVLSMLISAAFVVWSFVNRDQMLELSVGIKDAVTKNLGWFFVLVSTGSVIYLIYLALSRFGDIVLGDPDEKPEFGDISWFSMLFSTGMGTGILFWGAAEPLTHYLHNPLVESQTPEAGRMAMALTMFHWGVHGWGVYTLCAVAVAYYGFRKRKNYLISSCLTGIQPFKSLDRPLAVLVDVTATVAIVFGLATSLAMGTIQLATGIQETTGWNASSSTGYQVILMIITITFLISATTGLEKGIKILSNLNMATCVTLLAFVFIAGPTLFDIKLFVDSIGSYISNLPSLSFQVAPFTPEYESWMSNWTITYFTWWIAWAPFVGIFVARISRGRTIKELIFGALMVPVLFTIFWFCAFGGAALTLVMNGDQVFVNLIETGSYEVALFHLLGSMPMSTITIIAAIFLLFTFLVTSADSACFVLAMMTSEGDLDPTMRLKAMWAILMAVLTSLLLHGGSLDPIRASAQLSAGPFAVVLVLMAFSLPWRLRHQVRKRRI